MGQAQINVRTRACSRTSIARTRPAALTHNVRGKELIDVSWHCRNGTRVKRFYCKSNDLGTRLTAVTAFSLGVTSSCCPVSAGTTGQAMLLKDQILVHFLTPTVFSTAIPLQRYLHRIVLFYNIFNFRHHIWRTAKNLENVYIFIGIYNWNATWWNSIAFPPIWKPFHSSDIAHWTAYILTEILVSTTFKKFITLHWHLHQIRPTKLPVNLLRHHFNKSVFSGVSSKIASSRIHSSSRRTVYCLSSVHTLQQITNIDLRSPRQFFRGPDTERWRQLTNSDTDMFNNNRGTAGPVMQAIY